MTEVRSLRRSRLAYWPDLVSEESLVRVLISPASATATVLKLLCACERVMDMFCLIQGGV